MAARSNFLFRFLAAILVFFAADSSFAQSTANIQYTVADFQLTPQSIRAIRLTPMLSYGLNGGYIISGDSKTLVTDNTGSVTFSNVTVGMPYQAAFVGNFTTTYFTNVFPLNIATNGTINAKDWTFYSFIAKGPISIVSIQQILNGLTNAVTPAQASNIVYSLANTNPIAAGTNITFTTNGNIITISSAGSGSATNVFVGAGSNVTVATNSTSFTVSATNQTFLTNGLLAAAEAYSQNYSNITNPPVIPSTNGFINASTATNIANGSSSAATNGFGNIVTHSVGEFQPASANLTNWSGVATGLVARLTDATNISSTAAQNATNGIGIGSGLSAFVSTNRFDTNGAATSAANAATNAMGPSSGLMAFQQSNVWASLIQTTNIVNGAAIANNNGIGTNTTIVSGKTISTTNLFVSSNAVIKNLIITNGGFVSTSDASSVAVILNNTTVPVLTLSDQANQNGAKMLNFTAPDSISTITTGISTNWSFWIGSTSFYAPAPTATFWINPDDFSVSPFALIIESNAVGIEAGNAYLKKITSSSTITAATSIGVGMNIMTGGYLSLGGGLTFINSTNILGVTNCASAGVNGTYQYFTSPATYTNLQNSLFTIIFSSPTWFLQSNGTSLYQASSLNGTWSVVGGAATPVPSVFIGGYFRKDGWLDVGYQNGTNEFYNITNQAALWAQRATNGFVLNSQPASANLTNWSNITTDSIPTFNFTTNLVAQSTNTIAAWTTNNYATLIVAGTNAIVSQQNTVTGKVFTVSGASGVTLSQVTNVANASSQSATNGYAATVTNIAQSLITSQSLTPSTVLTNQTLAGVPTMTNWDGEMQVNAFGMTNNPNVNGVYLKITANIWTNNLYNGSFIQSNGVTWTLYTNSTSLALYTSNDGQSWSVNNGQSPGGVSRIGVLKDFDKTAQAMTNINGAWIKIGTHINGTISTATNLDGTLSIVSGLWTGSTNPVYVINAYEHPEAAGKYAWSSAYSALTNSAATNIMLRKDTSWGWLIGTNANDDTGDKSLYYYVGSYDFPTNDVADWVTNENLGNQVIGLDIVNATTATNSSFTTKTAGGVPQTALVNPVGNFQAAQSSVVVLAGFFSTNGTFQALATVGQENQDIPNYAGRIQCFTWGPGDLSRPMANCGRFIGVMGNWSGDNRAYIAKGMGNVSQAGGGAFILETYAATGSPGNHGSFNNSMYVATNGLMAIGNLTDTADDNNNTLKPPFWLTIYGDGSTWSGGSSTLPSFGIMPKNLVTVPVNGAYENDGTNIFWTDKNASRHKVQLADGDSSGLGTLATNRLVFSSVSALTNTLGRNATALLTAGTSVILQDTNGNNIATIGTVATLDVPIPMNVNMRLSGTGVSAVLY